MGKGGEGEEGNRESGVLCLLEWSLNCSCAFEKEAMYMMFLKCPYTFGHILSIVSCVHVLSLGVMIWLCGINNETGALLTRDS